MILQLLGKMKILPILVTLLSATWVKSQTFPECDLQSDGTSIGKIHDIYIDDDESGSVLLLTTANVLAAEIGATGPDIYFEIAFNSELNTLELVTSTEYANIEQNEPSGNAITKLNLEINLDCGAAVILRVDVTITDKNNQPTEFTEAVITYNIPLPLPAKIPLYLFTDTPEDNKLTARDADISNDLITFELSPDDVFQINYAKDARDPLGKTFVATISTKTPLIELPDGTTYTVTAKDNQGGDPTSMQITLNIDQASSIPASPVFNKKIYDATYSKEHEFNVDPLILANPSALHTIVENLDQGDIGDFFAIAYDAGTTTLTITKHTDLSDEILDSNDVLILLVEVSYQEFPDSSTTVSVLVTLPPKDQSVQQAFAEVIYTAKYDEDIVELDVPILVTIPDLEIAIVESDISKYFQLQENIENPFSIEIVIPEPPLPTEVIEGKEYITLVLTAKIADTDHGSTVIVIDIPAEECPIEPSENVFSKTLYKGDYSNEGDHSINLENIALTTEDVLIVVIDPNEYPDNFLINYGDIKDIRLELIKALEQDVLDELEVISLILVAKSVDGNTIHGSSVIILDLPPAECSTVPLNYAFDSSLYNGNYLTSDPPNVEIELITASAEELLLIDIKENEFKQYFSLNTDELPEVKVILASPIPPNIIEASPFITLVLTAEGTESNLHYGEAVVAIELPPKPTETIEHVFGQSLYEGIYKVDGSHSVEFEDIIVNSDNELKIDFITSDFSVYFQVEFTPPDVLITIKEEIPEAIIEANDFITLILSATSTDGTIDYGETGLVINLPEKICSIEPSNDIFVKAVIEGEYLVPEAGPHTVQTETNSVNNNAVEVSIVGDYANNFDVTVTTESQIVLSIENELTADIWNDNRYISILLQGTHEGKTGAARIILALPEPECKDPEPSITFQDQYFTLDPDYTDKKIGDLVATFDPPEPHTFTISRQPGWVVLNDAVLNIAENSALKPGTFKFTATAIGTDSLKTKDAEITIYVKNNLAGEAKTQYSLMVVRIEEEKVHDEILQLDDERIGADIYEYVIESQQPAGPVFRIDAKDDKKFLMCDVIDREDALFADMPIAQVVLTLSIQKKSTSSNMNSLLATHPLFKYIMPSKRQNRNGPQCLMLDKDIFRYDHIMHVPVIIEDANDSPPVFSATSVVIGYPTKDLAYDINPPYLFKVVATDADEGVNAEIEYSTLSTSIQINSKTGVLYPTEGLYNEEQKITMTVTASDGKTPVELVVNVVLLDEDHISVLIFPNVALEDLDEKLATLSAVIDAKLWSLAAGTLPLSNDARMRAESDMQLKAFVYAIDGEEALSHDDLKEKLAGTPDVTVMGYSPAITDDDDDCDDTGLIAGISVLAVALAICIGGFIAYYCKKRNNNASLDFEQAPEHKTSFKKSNASSLNGFNNEHVLKDVATRRPTQYPSSPPKIEPDSNTINSSSSSEDGEDFDEARERRKSVTFNEKTEHFDITAKENEIDSTKADETEDKQT